ncbi:MAG: RsmE family RNA methyltransferase [Candidatus Limivicinus sp.]|nr:16S rRNA (uracil(1498)-N(3))-methyltransferase [Clostridiales bacterium]MCI7136029.1 16S rRNA (uracil(1498)-N(3))-methyltransferase [Clostridiales bacterium]MDY6132686.1 RsmE family RNA methyltransferase [Candidatus Limivicinus sp.]
MPRFFMAGTNILGGMAIMTGRDAEHVRVLRLRPGEDMIICDGKGTDYKCRLVKADKEQVEAEVIEIVPCPAEPSVQVTVLCGLPKGDRTDYIIQKCVEAGASEIMFFQSDRCVAKPDKPEKKLERWQRIAEEAAKQSGRGIIPQVSWAGEYADALNVANQKELGLFMYETGEREALNAVLEANSDVKTAAIVTGPEGGFAPFEADLARIVGLHICSMGERILRCETAPVVAVSALMYATGNLS